MQSPNTDALTNAVDPDPVQDAVDREPWWHTAGPYAILTAAAVIALSLLAGVLYGIWWLISSALDGLKSLGEGAVESTSGIVEPVVRTVTDPVHHYIHTHTGGFPIAAQHLWWAWIAAVAVFFILAALGSYGARIGWTVIGAITIALVWADTTPDTQMLAAGTTAAVWAVLSIIALNQLVNDDTDPSTRVVIIRPEPTTDVEP